MLNVDIDIAIVGYIIANLFASITISVIVLKNRESKKDLSNFIHSFLLTFIGASLMLVKPYVPMFFGVIAAKVFIFFGKLLLLRGVVLFYKLKKNYVYYYIAMVLYTAGFIYFTYIANMSEFRMLINVASIASIHFIIALKIYNHQKTNKRKINIMFIINSYYVLLMLARIPLHLVSGREGLTFGSIFSAIVILMDSISAMLILAGILSMINNRDNLNLRESNAKIIKSERSKNSILFNIHGFTYRCVNDRDWTMEKLSDSFMDITGYEPEEIIGNRNLSYNDIIAVQYRDEVWQIWSDCIKKHIPYMGEYELTRKDGKNIWVWEHGHAIYGEGDEVLALEGFITDVTEIKKLRKANLQMEAHLRNQQKLDAIGTLAGGVAHEINNPINGIMNYAQLIKDMTDPDHEIAEYAYEIISETERVASIVSNLLQFSVQQESDAKVTGVEEPFRQTVALFETIIKKDQINLQVEIENNLPEVECKCRKLQQVLMNLLTNAREH